MDQGPQPHAFWQEKIHAGDLPALLHSDVSRLIPQNYLDLILQLLA